MHACPKCRHHLDRVRRTRTERLLFSDAFGCANCGYRQRDLHRRLDVNVTLFASRHTCCIRCGNTRVRALAERDLIDRMSRHPVSQIFRLVCAPLRRCPACRLQYNDWRPAAPIASHA